MSDSHDNLTNIQKAIGFFLNEGVEKIIHCGDMVAPFIGRAMQALKGTEIETVAIYGNNDGERDAFHSMMGDFVNFPGIFYDCNWNDCNIAVYHGTLDKILNCIIDSKHYEVVLCGHTHQKRVETRDGVLDRKSGGVLRVFDRNGDDCGNRLRRKASSESSVNIIEIE